MRRMDLASGSSRHSGSDVDIAVERRQQQTLHLTAKAQRYVAHAVPAEAVCGIEQQHLIISTTGLSDWQIMVDTD